MADHGPTIITQLLVRPPGNTSCAEYRNAREAAAGGIPAGTGLGEVFVRGAITCAERPALVMAEGLVWTYGRLLAAAAQIAEHLRGPAELSRGDRVVLLLKNSPEYAAAFYGTLLAGGVVVPLPPDAEARRLRQIVASCEARVILTAPGVLRRHGWLREPRGGTLELGGEGEGMAPVFEAEPAGEALAALFFTSGSTGEPKGVMLSHANLLANARSIVEYLRIGADERGLALLPFYHAFGNSVLQTHLLSGASLVLDGSLMFPETILEAVRRHGVTNLCGVPDVFRVLLSRTSLGESALPSLRSAAVAGGRLEPDQALAVAARIAPARFFVMYGQTEATARLAYLPPEELENRYGSLGKGIPGVELQVVDDAGGAAAPGETGEIRARGANVMLGYWRDPELTAQTIRDGWLYTGDLASVDAGGYIYPQGRRNALVKIGGYRVHPREVEEFLSGHVDAQQIVVVPFETAETGTRLAAFVQPWDGDGALSAEEVRRLCAAGLPRHKVPEYVEVASALPLNDALKIDRAALSRRACEAVAGSGRVQNSCQPASAGLAACVLSLTKDRHR